MKRLILIAALFAVAVCAKAQTIISGDFAAQIGSTKTLTNAQADTVNLQITKARPSIAFKYDISKTSGTVAGTVVLQGRVTASDQWTQLNSYNLTDATATNTVVLTANNYVYYRVITTTTGTQVSVHKKYLTTRTY
jgi:hypothetical protein